MAKDYAKIKALAASILECIGDDDEGESPSLPSQNNDFNDGGQESLSDFVPSEDGQAETGVPKGSKSSDDDDDDDKKKKKKDSSMAMMAATLASNVKSKSGY